MKISEYFFYLGLTLNLIFIQRIDFVVKPCCCVPFMSTLKSPEAIQLIFDVVASGKSKFSLMSRSFTGKFHGQLQSMLWQKKYYLIILLIKK